MSARNLIEEGEVRSRIFASSSFANSSSLASCCSARFRSIAYSSSRRYGARGNAAFMPTLTEGDAEAPKATARAKATLNGNCERHSMAISFAKSPWKRTGVEAECRLDGGGYFKLPNGLDYWKKIIQNHKTEKCLLLKPCYMYMALAMVQETASRKG